MKHVKPGPRGAFKDTSPQKHSWHHNAQNPEKIQLVPKGQHRAPGPVQGSLHPNQGVDLKNLQEGVIHDERKNEFN